MIETRLMRYSMKKIPESFGLDIAKVLEVEDSHSSEVFKVILASGEIVYVKYPYSKLKYQRELDSFNILNEKVRIPKLLDYNSETFLLSELKGRPLSKNDPPNISYQVGVLHAKLHNVQPEKDTVYSGIKNEFPHWNTFVEQMFEGFKENVKSAIDKDLYHKSILKFEQMKNNLPEPDGPCFIHMDFRPANIIVDEDTVTGVIDFESVRFGSSEIDFTKIYRDYLRFDADVFAAYKEGYRSVRPLIDLSLVLPFYEFTNAFMSIGWCVKRGITENQSFYDASLETLISIINGEEPRE